MQATTISCAPNDYRVLAEQIPSAKLLERRPWYCGAKIGLTVAGFAAGWVALTVGCRECHPGDLSRTFVA